MPASFKKPAKKPEIEEGSDFTPAFDENGLIPCITQDAATGEVVMFAFMNEASLAKTIETGQVWYWSRSRKQLWHKGATSGSIQTVVEMRIDCDQDVILVKVKTGGDGSNCHRMVKSCFYRTITANPKEPPASTLESDS